MPTAAKPDSQDVCFIRRREGRSGFLGDRLSFTPGRVVDTAGRVVGAVDAVELVTVGQRRGLGLAGGHAPRYVLDVDVAAATVVVGAAEELLVDVTPFERWSWSGEPVDGAGRRAVLAHGEARRAVVDTAAGVAPLGGAPPAGGTGPARRRLRRRRGRRLRHGPLIRGDAQGGGGRRPRP